MKKSFLLALGITALGFSMGQADPPASGGFKPSYAVRASVTKPNPNLKPRLEIPKLGTRPAGNKILIEGVVRHSPGIVADGTPLGATWTISRVVGGQWVTLGSGQIVLKPNQQTTVRALGSSGGVGLFKLELRPHGAQVSLFRTSVQANGRK